MSDNVRLDHRAPPGALPLLTRLVRHLGEELAGYRKRALTAEARLRAIDEHSAAGGLSLERSQELERENQDLRARLTDAQERTEALLKRVQFLRQQHDQAGAA